MRSRNALYNISTNLILQLIVIIYGFVVPKIIINSFGSSVNGLVSSITQFLGYIALLESGFGPVVKAALYKPIAKKNKKEISNILKTTEKFFKTISYIFLLYIFILCLVYPFIVVSNFSWIYTASLIAIIGLSTFAEYFFGMTYRLYLQAEQKTYVISIIQIVAYIISIIVIIVLARFSVSVHLIKLASCLIFIIRPLIQNMYVKKKYNLSLKSANSNYEINQKWDGLAQHIASVIHNNADVTILTIFSSLVEVSVYSVYYLVVKGLKAIILSFTGGIDAIFGDMLAKNESENLNQKFDTYEVLYNIISTVLFTSGIILIVPFVEVYTSGVTDANYIRYVFGYLIVTSEYIWAIRQSYNELIKAAGHFKQTKAGAWIECLLNIVISVALVGKLGLIGVAIGTIIAMTIRTIEFIYYSNKHILKRNPWNSFKKIIFVIFETLIIVFVCNFIPYLENVSYINWFINAILTSITAMIITSTLNFIFFKKDLLYVFKLIKGFTKKENKKNA